MCRRLLYILESQNVTIDAPLMTNTFSLLSFIQPWPSLYHSRIIHVYVDEPDYL